MSTATMRVDVVGTGAITCFGRGVEALWAGVKAGRVGITPVHSPEIEALGSFVGAAVPDPPTGTADGIDSEPAIEFAIAAAAEALDQAAKLRAEVPPERWAVIIGTCNGGLSSAERFLAARAAGRDGDPRLLMQFAPHAVAEAVARAFGLRGPCLTFSTACSSSTVAAGFGADLIRSRHADAVLAGGSDAFSRVTFAGFSAMEALAPVPAKPFTLDRPGLSIGEGSGMLVLTSHEHALRSGSKLLGEIAGYGLSADGYHPTAPHPQGEGAARAIGQGLEWAGVSADQVGYVNAHGTGTPKNDAAETHAIRTALGTAADKAAVSSTKSMIGHLMGAAGAVEAIVTLKALQEQVAPPTAGYDRPDPECDLNYVPNHSAPVVTDVALSNSFAFGGHNAALVMARPDRTAGPRATSVHDVLVTGVGLLTPWGETPAELNRGIPNGSHSRHANGHGAVELVNFDPELYISSRAARRMDKLTLLALAGARKAMADAGLEINEANRTHVGLVFGTGVGPADSLERFVVPILTEGLAAASPALFPNCVQNAPAGQVSIQIQALGSSLTVSAGFASGVATLACGYEFVRSGRADIVLCVAADALTDLVVDSYQRLAGGTMRLDASLAEAGVCLVLEARESAERRGARAYGAVLGWSSTGDACAPGGLDPTGTGIERAIRTALQQSGREPQAVRRMWMSGDGNARGESAESAAIARLGWQAEIEHPKMTFGDVPGASGALAAGLAFAGTTPGVEVVSGLSMGGTNLALVLEVGKRAEA